MSKRDRVNILVHKFIWQLENTSFKLTKQTNGRNRSINNVFGGLAKFKLLILTNHIVYGLAVFVITKRVSIVFSYKTVHLFIIIANQYVKLWGLCPWNFKKSIRKTLSVKCFNIINFHTLHVNIWLMNDWMLHYSCNYSKTFLRSYLMKVLQERETPPYSLQYFLHTWFSNRLSYIVIFMRRFPYWTRNSW